MRTNIVVRDKNTVHFNTPSLLFSMVFFCLIIDLKYRLAFPLCLSNKNSTRSTFIQLQNTVAMTISVDGTIFNFLVICSHVVFQIFDVEQPNPFVHVGPIHRISTIQTTNSSGNFVSVLSFCVEELDYCALFTFGRGAHFRFHDIDGLTSHQCYQLPRRKIGILNFWMALAESLGCLFR